MVDVSFIIPIYNNTFGLREYINGAEKYFSASFEVLLIDDGSEQETSKLCDKLAADYENVKCFHQKNSGASAARNKGIQIAEGKYIIFLDSDDSVDMNGLYSCYLKMKDHPSADLLIYGLTMDYYKDGNIYRSDKLAHKEERCMSNADAIRNIYQLYKENMLSPVWNKIHKKAVIENNKLRFDESMIIYEDLDFELRYLMYSTEMIIIPDTVYHYRQSEDEGNAGRRLRRIPSISDFLEKITDTAQLINDAEEQCSGVNRMIADIYEILLREKAGVSSLKEIKYLCEEMKGNKYLDRVLNTLPENRRVYTTLIAESKARAIFFRKTKTKVRHRAAVLIKSSDSLILNNILNKLKKMIR